LPIYSYRCDQCSAVFDAYNSMPRAGDPVSHDCGGTGTRHYAKTPSITFRPEGYYLSPEDPKYWSTLKDKEPRLACQQ
jgi:putative FmdB family regulatory protein